jgi:hypothetical protein
VCLIFFFTIQTARISNQYQTDFKRKCEQREKFGTVRETQQTVLRKNHQNKAAIVCQLKILAGLPRQDPPRRPAR